jgi:hypothetical protein
MENNNKTAGHNSTYSKVAIPWLNNPHTYRDCVSFKVYAWLTVKRFEIATSASLKRYGQV